MLRLAFDFIITWRETRTRPNAYDECIGQLLKFLDRNNSGLSVMFSSNIDESNPTWNAQELASNGKSVNMECNQ